MTSTGSFIGVFFMSQRMTAAAVAGLVCLGVASAAPAWAQRGGRSVGGGTPEVMASKTLYENKAFGIKFAVPPGLELHTPDSPGRYRAAFTDRKIVLLVNPLRVEDTIAVKYADGMTEANVRSYQAILESNPPQAKLPGYEKVSLAFGKIGKDGAEEGVEFVYRAQQNGEAVTIRQAVFVHNGRGFTVTCTSVTKDYDMANREWFERLLREIEFS